MNKFKQKKSPGSSHEATWSRTKWGQNFLRDPKILKKIVDFAHIEKDDTVVEIGSGEGTLTKLLLDQAKKVIAIEKDEKLVELLKQKFEVEIKEEKLKIIAGDILKMPKGVFEMPRARKTPLGILENYVLVGNIPYYITGALFKKFLGSENQPFNPAHGKPKSITFVVQKEVAERIIAKNGKESILSISIKAYGKPKFGGIIKAGSFFPKPKVDSAIIAIRNISNKNFLRGPLRKSLKGVPLGNLDLEKKFFEILKAGFAHKRKLLIKNLEKIKGHPLGPNFAKASLDKQNSSRVPLPMAKGTFATGSVLDAFKKCGIPEKSRAEDLKVEDWICLVKNLLLNK